jgi:undecaprenyl-diphosphatase
MPIFDRATWNSIADLGDMALIAPSALAVALVLVIQGRRRDAFGWLGAIAACAVLTLMLKETVGAFHWTVFGHTFSSNEFPSGHASMSTVFYGGLAILLWSSTRGLAGRALGVLLVGLVLLIGIAVRLLLWHYGLEIAGGMALGAACATAGAVVYRHHRSSRQLAAVVAAVALLVLVLHGERWDDHLGSLRLAASFLKT